MMKKSPRLSRREFVGVLAASATFPLLGRAAQAVPQTQPAPTPPAGRTLEQERREASENMEKALQPIRAFSLRGEIEPAFIFRARR